MKLLKEDLKNLIEVRGYPCISIYTSIRNPVNNIAKIKKKLSSQVAEAGGLLAKEGFDRSRTREILKSLYTLCDKPGSLYDGLSNFASFIAPGFCRYYSLPADYKNEVYVSDRFFIKPLLSLFAENDVFYVLVLSFKNICLYRYDKFNAHNIPIYDIKTMIDNMPQYDIPEQKTQFETIRDLLQIVNKKVSGILGKNNSPLVLAGTEDIVSLYKEINSYPFLMDKWIQGNPDRLTPEIVYKKAYPIVEDILLDSFHQAVAQYFTSTLHGKASFNIEDIIVSSYKGKVLYMFANADYNKWGKFYPDKKEIEIHRENLAGDENLVDFAIVYTLVNGGKVFISNPRKIPEKVPVAAVYRN